jgi:hypothetical protein
MRPLTGIAGECNLSIIRGRAQDEEPRVRHTCNYGVGCEEAGVCYAAAHGLPDECGKPVTDNRPESLT